VRVTYYVVYSIGMRLIKDLSKMWNISQPTPTVVVNADDIDKALGNLAGASCIKQLEPCMHGDMRDLKTLDPNLLARIEMVRGLMNGTGEEKKHAGLRAGFANAV